MSSETMESFRALIEDTTRIKFIESLLTIENKDTSVVPFKLNPIQRDALSTASGRDIYVKPGQVGFSSVKLAQRLIDTLVVPGTNTVLVAYEDFITERLLSKVDFFYNHLAGLNIPGFPIVHHNSTYQKTYEFNVNGRTVSKSSIYIASARSAVAGRAEVIHHLLCDEFAFWVPDAIPRIMVPAMKRVPPNGTIDIFSTPNAEDNSFCAMYKMAKEGKSVFKHHFYPWTQHPEYRIELGDLRVELYIPETNSKEFPLTVDEEVLVARGVTYSQIRWRRWSIKELESLSKNGEQSGESRKYFQQEFPEDDVSCFLVAGDMYFDTMTMNQKAAGCYEATHRLGTSHVWFQPIDGQRYVVSIDPGQAKVTMSAITVLTFINGKPVYCARDAGLYSPEVTVEKAKALSQYYNKAMIVWEANGHGLAISVLLHQYRPIYMRKDLVSGQTTLTPGWLTTGGKNGTKHYLMHNLDNMLSDMVVHDLEFVSQCRNIRLSGDDAMSVGMDDILMSCAIGLICFEQKRARKGLVGTTGWRW